MLYLEHIYTKKKTLFIWNSNLSGHSGFFVFPKSGNPTYHYARKNQLEERQGDLVLALPTHSTIPISQGQL